MRDELVVRNVAHLAELPSWKRNPITPWTADKARAFLEAAKDDPLYSAFVLLQTAAGRRDLPLLSRAAAHVTPVRAGVNISGLGFAVQAWRCSIFKSQRDDAAPDRVGSWTPR
jgi:hypothetical protein